ncbi:MAG: hypothetical protein C0485_09905 [Pirellula sp.]|nr:hypothetical protein [Pirellula sp.]
MTDEEIVRAIVKLPKLNGLGALLAGEMVITAAHCIGWSLEGGMALGDTYHEEIETASGVRFFTSPIFIDPIADIAVLGPVDDQQPSLRSHYASFCDFSESVSGLKLSTVNPDLFAKIPLRVRTHTGEWNSGYGQFCEPLRRLLFCETSQQIIGGTSGSPILDKNGDVMAVISHGTDMRDGDEFCEGSAGFAARCLPAWVVEKAMGD